MMNLFKRAKKEYPAIVQEIHNEFNSAGDKLLDKAKDLLNKLPGVNIQKVERLKSLGFKQAEEVKQAEQVITQKEQTKEIIKLAKYYKTFYPHNKFITYEEVERICKKYRLVLGGVDRFKGFIPEEKIMEIENFKLRKGDVAEVIVRDRNEGIVGYLKMADLGDHANFIRRSGRSYMTGESGTPVHGDIPSSTYQQFSHLEYATINNGSAAFQICAPVSDMDMTGMTITQGYKVSVVDKDPIVLQPVKGGYLIVACWGDEAADPDVVNSIHN